MVDRASSERVLTLAGSALTCEDVAMAAGPGCNIYLAPEATGAMHAARAVVRAAVASGTPAYGVTTGLGSNATKALSAAEISSFSVETLKGRAHAAGPPLPARVVRAAMVARIHSFCSGAAGVDPFICQHLVDLFNAELTPVVGAWGSIGAADLLLGASMGLAAMGLGGRLQDANGQTRDAAEALAAASLVPPTLGPRDGLALANHSCFSAGAAALAAFDAERSLAASLRATALSLHAFGANLTPLDPDVLRLKPYHGDMQCAQALRHLLGGATRARRLQDPLSLRNAVHAHGMASDLVGALRTTVEVELNGSSDNPAVVGIAQAGYSDAKGDQSEARILSTGNYFTPRLTAACETAARALASVSVMTVARISKLCCSRLSGLSQYLADPSQGTNGFAPMLKMAESLLSGIHARAAHVAPWPSVNADGVEDALALSFDAALRLSSSCDLFDTLTALECIVAAQAIDLRSHPLPPSLQPTYDAVRGVSKYISASRPLAAELEALAAALPRLPSRRGLPTEAESACGGRVSPPQVDMQWARAACRLLGIEEEAGAHEPGVPERSPPVHALARLRTLGGDMRPLAAPLGLQVTGLLPEQFDAAGPALNAAFSSAASGGLLLIRGCGKVDAKHLLALSAHFGALEDNPTERAKRPGEVKHLHRNHNEILLLGTDERGRYRPVFELSPPPHTSTIQACVDGGPELGLWHTDQIYREPIGARGSTLLAVEVPSKGGHTAFAAAEAAALALPPALLARCASLHQCVSLAGLRRRSLIRERRSAGAPGNELKQLASSWGEGSSPKEVALRPLVVRDKGTGLPALYAPGTSASHGNDVPGSAVAELPAATGDALVVALLRHLTQPAFTHVHKWQPGDIVIWANRRTAHSAMSYQLNDGARVMWRVTFDGPHGEAVRPPSKL